MKVCKFKTSILLILMLFSVRSFAENSQVLKINYYLLTGNTEKAISSIRKHTADAGGYVKFFSGNRIIIRIPREAAVKFRSFITDMGYIIDEQVFRNNISEKMLELQTKLRAKDKLLKDLYSLFTESEFHQTLDVESEIGKLIMEIEKIKGRINYYADRVALSEVTVNLNPKKITVRNRSTAAKWDWIRRLGITGLLNIQY